MLGVARLVGSISLPRLREHPLRTALTAVGIMLGVAVLVAVVLVNRSILKSVQSAIDDISGKVDWQVSAGNAGIDESLIKVIRETKGVLKAAPVIQETVRIATGALNQKQALALEGQNLIVLGVNLLGSDDEYFRSYNSQEINDIKADPLAFLNSPVNIILSEQFASKYGFKIEDELPLLTPSGQQRFRIKGFIRDDRLSRAFGGGLAVMYHQAAQVAFNRGNLVDRFDIAVEKNADPQVVRGNILHALGDAEYEIEHPERRTARVNNMLKGLSLFMVMGSFLALLVGMFLILNTVSISVVQRKQEIGILRALGATRRQILYMFILEGAVMGVAGSALGILVGLYLSRFLLVGMTRSVSEVYLRIQVDSVQIDGLLILFAFGAGIVATLLSSIFPARMATRVVPIEAIRSTSQIQMATDHRRVNQRDAIAVLLGAATVGLYTLKPISGVPVGGYLAMFTLMLAFSLIMPRVLLLVQFGLRPLIGRVMGVEGQLANESISHNLGRATMGAAALMIATGMVLAFAVFLRSFEESMLKWVDQTIPADLFVTSANPLSAGSKNAHMSNDMYGYLSKLPGVKAIDRMRVADFSLNDAQPKLLSSDWPVLKTYAAITYIEGTQDEADKGFAAGDSILVSENFARRYGYHKGDKLEVPTPGGKKSFRIAAVIVNYSHDQGTVMIDREAYMKIWKDDLVDTYQIYLQPNADQEATRRAIFAKYGKVYTLFVLTHAEFRGEIVKLLSQVFRVVDILQIVALIIAMLGVMNTMLASVIDRIREIGVLRALGALRSQVRKMVIIEAGIIGIASSLAGVCVGLLAGVIMLYAVNKVQLGWLFPFSLPVRSMAQGFMLIIGSAIIAGWYPARQAARLAVVASIKYE